MYLVHLKDFELSCGLLSLKEWTEMTCGICTKHFGDVKSLREHMQEDCKFEEVADNLENTGKLTASELLKSLKNIKDQKDRENQRNEQNQVVSTTENKNTSIERQVDDDCSMKVGDDSVNVKIENKRTGNSEHIKNQKSISSNIVSNEIIELD